MENISLGQIFYKKSMIIQMELLSNVTPLILPIVVIPQNYMKMFLELMVGEIILGEQ